MHRPLKVGVFVDAENIRLNGGYQLRYDVLRQFAARNGGTLLRLNTYITFDPKRAESDPDYLKKAGAYQQRVRDFGWKVIVKNIRRYYDDEGGVTTKANSDLDLAVDAMLQSENLDQVLMVTGDGDFLKVVNALQNRGCRVELLAFKNVSRELQRQADEFFSGYLIPDLLPVQEPNNQWGEPGSVVRGICTKWFPEKGYGFFRYITRLDANLWMTDPRNPASPYESVFCHVNDLAADVAPERLMSHDTIVEFVLRESDQKENGLSAAHVRLVT